MPRPIVMLSDFGTADPFVGIMKCVVHGLAPGAQTIDLGHDVPPHDVLAGAIMLEDALPWLPASGIVCAVVDPGVGGSRRALAIRSRHRVFVGPDNGLLTPVLRDDPAAAAFEILPGGPISPGRSATFHGRDVFAPAAAMAARGETMDTFARPVDSAPFQLPWPQPRVLGDSSVALTVLHVDRFGNCALNARRSDGETPEWLFGEGFEAEVAGRAVLGPARTYGDAAPGEPVMYVNSAGRLEFAVNMGNAARKHGMARGSEMVLRKRPAR